MGLPDGLHRLRPRRQPGGAANAVHAGKDRRLRHRMSRAQPGHGRGRISGDQDDPGEGQVLHLGWPHQGNARRGLFNL